MNTQRPPRLASRTIPYGEVIGMDGDEIVCHTLPNLLPDLFHDALVDEIVMLRKLLRVSLRGLKIQITDSEEFFRDKIKKAAIATGEHEDDVLAVIAPLMRQNLEEMLVRPSRKAKLADQVRGGVQRHSVTETTSVTRHDNGRVSTHRTRSETGSGPHRLSPHDDRDRNFSRNRGPGPRPDRTQG